MMTMKGRALKSTISLLGGITLFTVMTLNCAAQTDAADLRQYVFPEFSQSIVKVKGGATQRMLLNYNTITEKMVFRKDTMLLNIGKPATVDTITILDRKFVPVGEAFYEVAAEGPVPFFIQHKSNITPPGKPAAYGGTSQTSSVDIVSQVSLNNGLYNLKIPNDYVLSPSPFYWVRKDGKMESFVNKRQFLKLFPDKSDELGQFIDRNKIKIDNRDDLIRLGQYCNELYK